MMSRLIGRRFKYYEYQNSKRNKRMMSRLIGRRFKYYEYQNSKRHQRIQRST